jgi:hypothetical protein
MPVPHVTDSAGLLVAVARGLEWLCPRPVRRIVPLVLALLAGLYATVFLVCVGARLLFPYELSWLESGMQAMTDRVSAGQSIYAPPSAAYVPFMYPPLYYVTAHGLGRVLPWLGPFVPMRLLSSLATATIFLVVFLTLGRSTRLGLGRRLLLATLVIAFYGRLAFWYDSSRVDSFATCLVFATTALLIEGRSLTTALAAGCLGGVSILAKQPAVPLLVGAAMADVLGSRRGRALVVLPLSAAVACAGLALLGELRNPWLYFYTLRVPPTYPYDFGSLGSGASYVLCTMPMFLLAAAAGLGRRALRDGPAASSSPPCQDGRRSWALTFAAWLVIGVVLRLRDGSTVNFFLPLVPVGIVLAAAAYERLGAMGEPLLLVQFLVLLYNPLPAIPTEADVRAGSALLSSLRRIPGDVYLPQFPAYLRMVGKPPVAHGVAVCDVSGLRPDLVEVIRAQIEQGHYAAVVPWKTAKAQAPCRPQDLPAPFRLLEEFPHGGPFFVEGHENKVAGFFIRDPVTPKAQEP